ncbi:hypothetical protein LZ554_007108 [Drepanopeziza brunnea f. sp. 'monogermtubi']|nr:hypothetical protein LZ554_007108 [Drepanopeziza brunnea f. sp. 'monogermtubi']
MTSNLPRTPETPSQTSPAHSNLPSKPVTSPADTHSMPTPARSVNGSMSTITVEGFAPDDTSLKRKRDIGDQGNQETKKVQVEASEKTKEVTVEDISQNVGSLYLFCKTPHVPRLPSLLDDLFERYGLNDVAKSVARIHPDGTKAVKLRKTYKNHIKDHGILGSFDAIKNEVGAPGTLGAMMKMPDDVWNAEFVRGKEIEKGIPESMLAKGHTIFTMSKGPIPKAQWNPAILNLGTGDSVAPAQVEKAKAAQNGSRTPVPQAQAQAVRPVQGKAKGDLRRPSRTTTKRSYADSSFEGYGEGYVDDVQDPGYSTGDGDDRSGRKRVKKNTQSHGGYQQGGAMRQSGYGPGMVGA